jgi:hypothetical protein
MFLTIRNVVINQNSHGEQGDKANQKRRQSLCFVFAECVFCSTLFPIFGTRDMLETTSF